MRPILFEFLGVKIASYAVFMVLGFCAALGVLLWLVPRNRLVAPGLHRTQVWDLFIVMLVSGILGSKMGHVLFEAPGHIGKDGQRIESVAELLADDPWHWLRITDPGYVWYGGMLACLITAVFYFWRRAHLPAWLYADVFAPAVMLGAAVGRIGCFFAGCCHGTPTRCPLGVQFPGFSTTVHPTQLYDASVALILAIYLVERLFKRKFDGENIARLLIAYPFFRTLTEFLRGDDDRGIWGWLSTSQWVSIPLLLIGVAVYRQLSKQRHLTPMDYGGYSHVSPETSTHIYS